MQSQREVGKERGRDKEKDRERGKYRDRDRQRHKETDRDRDRLRDRETKNACLLQRTSLISSPHLLYINEYIILKMRHTLWHFLFKHMGVQIKGENVSITCQALGKTTSKR
jgi:hypothetical protein